VTARVSLTGCVLAMHATAVKPPAAAARVPVAIVSLYSWPGSRRWTWMSMNPGAITRPPTSTVSAPGGASSRGPTRATVPAWISTSPGASRPFAGSITRPFRIRRSIAQASPPLAPIRR
jgi:hypothetical protein